LEFSDMPFSPPPCTLNYWEELSHYYRHRGQAAFVFSAKQANGWRYPLGVGAWTRRRNGSLPKPREMPENAVRTPSRVHAVLGGDNC